MAKRKILFIFCIIIILAYFYPRNAYKILHTKVNTQRVETIEITSYFPKSSPRQAEHKTTKEMKYKFQRNKVWDELRRIHAIRAPLLKYLSNETVTRTYSLQLFDEKILRGSLAFDEKILVIQGNYYYIVGEYEVSPEVFVFQEK